jgi:hypothetical protein
MKRFLLTRGLLGLISLAFSPTLFAGEPSLPLPLASHLSQKYQDDLKGLLAKRFVRVLTSFNKTNFFISGGRFYGCDPTSRACSNDKDSSHRPTRTSRLRTRLGG